MNIFESDISNCIKQLCAGGLILYPTDTIWGIGCDATNDEAVLKVFKLKKRPEEKSMIVLVADEKDLLQYVAAPDLRLFDYLEKTVKPTTVIYNNIIGIAANAINKDGTLGIRICKDDFCKHLIKRFQKPIISTSANVSGEPPPPSFADISEEIKSGVDYVVKYKQNDNKTHAPSSIIRWNRDGTADVIRT
jgi:L-threonylcarbamoyladenylate synthase